MASAGTVLEQQLVHDESFVTDLPGAAEQVFCPVCENRCAGPSLYRHSVEQAAAHFCPPTRDANRNQRLRHCISKLWQGNECAIMRCGQCGFAFGYPFVGGDEEFYSILHEQKAYPTWRWDYDVAMAKAVENCAGGNILDIGAGVGNFLRRLDGSWKCYAVEGSELTRRELEASGITVFRNLAGVAQSHAGTFQVVTLFQVLEHIADFNTLLKQCRSLLAPRGRLVVTVPFGEAMIRQQRLTGCYDMPPNHIGQWTPDSLSQVLMRAGFECGEPVFEPPSWKNLKANLHMRISADAADENSVAAQVYRISGRLLRVAALSVLAGPALLRMLPYGNQLRAGGAFAMVGIADKNEA
jgi:SAM-dependent methyltransferase